MADPRAKMVAHLIEAASKLMLEIARKDCVRDRPGDDRKPCGPIAARAEATIVLMEFAIPGAQISAVGAPRPAGRSGVEGRPEFVAVIIIALQIGRASCRERVCQYV